MGRGFTGWHMTGVMVAFFGVVIAVNMLMATEASRTFGGVVVENSYVASQRFNAWLGEARAQARLGWRAEAKEENDGELTVRLSGPAGPIDGALVAVEAEHPLGRLPGRAFTLQGTGGGRYAAPHALPPGRWRLRIEARSGARDARFEQDVRL
ncbi:FixH family protein [Sphingomonas gellani]|nr:FixH family protein [Sphingomonas gellani]